MAKRSMSGKRPAITLDQNAAMPLYRQLYERLRSAILAGQLEAHTRLPSTRTLASELGVSRNTTALAYEMLLLEGYIESRVGAGTRVSSLQAEQLFSPAKPGKEQREPTLTDPSPRLLAQRVQTLIDTAKSEKFSPSEINAMTNVFRAGQSDISSFPYETWARLVAKHARHSLQAVSFYQDAQGYAPLRESIATHIGITRGVHCSPDQIILTAGSQGALDLVARVLLDPNAPVWVEDPGYLGARGALLAAGAKLIPVPVDQEGMKVEVGRQLCPQARLAIVTPSHQFPTSVTMSLPRRLALLEWAKETGAWIVEDDYDSEFRFSGRPLEALQGLDGAQRVIYIGTFSKTLFPSLRLGYLVVPPALLEGFLATRNFIDTHLPLLEQLALADFMAEGHFARHLRKMRARYLERRDTLIEALTRELGELLEIDTPEAGMHLVAWLPLGVSARTVAEHISMRGLRIFPVVPSTSQPRQREGLLFGFASASPQELRAGVKLLAPALRAGLSGQII